MSLHIRIVETRKNEYLKFQITAVLNLNYETQITTKSSVKDPNRKRSKSLSRSKSHNYPIMFRSISSASSDNLPFAVGNRVRIRDSSGSKGAGSEGIVVSISAKMTRLDNGFTTKHKHIELVQPPPEPTVKKNRDEIQVQKTRNSSSCLQ